MTGRVSRGMLRARLHLPPCRRNSCATTSLGSRRKQEQLHAWSLCLPRAQCLWMPPTQTLLLAWFVCAGFAIVKLATDRKTNEQYAVKIMTLPPVGVTPGDNESTRCALWLGVYVCCLYKSLVQLAAMCSVGFPAGRHWPGCVAVLLSRQCVQCMQDTCAGAWLGTYAGTAGVSVHVYAPVMSLSMSLWLYPCPSGCVSVCVCSCVPAGRTSLRRLTSCVTSTMKTWCTSRSTLSRATRWAGCWHQQGPSRLGRSCLPFTNCCSA